MVDKYFELFRDIYKNVDLLYGNKKPEAPEIVRFLNIEKAAKILYRHIVAGSTIGIHTDVDMDGVGSCYIFRNWLLSCRPDLTVDCWINKRKQHGIDDSKVAAFNTTGKYDLLIILDSSTNEVESVKKLTCDCIVIDHHEVDIPINELIGNTAGITTKPDIFSDEYKKHPDVKIERCCEYVILNSLVDNPDGYEASDTMSAGLATYEFLRFFQDYFSLPYNVLEALKLYQWAVITLFTDKMNNDHPRNIYYIQLARGMSEKESGLSQMLHSLNCESLYISKSDINFTLAPTFNTAIRTGHSAEAINLALRESGQVIKLRDYRAIQQNALLGFDENINLNEKYVTKDITKETIEDELFSNYTGLIAMKLLDKFNRTALVYQIVGDNIAKGSFRGLLDSLDYRQLISDLGYVSQGHKTAFGFEIPVSELDTVMQYLAKQEEATNQEAFYLTAGNVKNRGKHHIDDIADFRATGNLWKLGILNSILSSDTNIVISSDDLEFRAVNTKGNYYTYNLKGITVHSFEEITTPLADMYVEFQDNLKIYIRNKYH